MYRGTIGNRLHGEIADKPGSQPWPTSSWTPLGDPLSDMYMLRVTALSMPLSRGQIYVPTPQFKKYFLQRGFSRLCPP